MQSAEIAPRIDYALLKVDANLSVDALRAAAETVAAHGLRSLVVSPVLAGTVRKNFPAIKVCAVVSYPLGLDTLGAKVFALLELAEQRVHEVDVVLDLFALLNGNRRKLELEAAELVQAAKAAPIGLKLIVEAALLDDDKLRWVCETLIDTGATCIKTSTGHHRPATTVEQVRLIRQVAGTRSLIKASGGIRTLYDAQRMLEAGADILGMSSISEILE
jgi:deoxyribose-phosphate aldolase